MNADEPATDDEQPDWAIFERSSARWHRVTIGDDHVLNLFVGAEVGPDGKPVITGIAMGGRELASLDMRGVPLGRIKAELAARPRCMEWLAEPEDDPLFDLKKVADDGPRNVMRRSSSRPTLRRPDGRAPEAFYRSVAEAYRYYVAVSRKPAVDISLEAQVPRATARRWINHARELGYLEKGQRGRAI